MLNSTNQYYVISQYIRQIHTDEKTFINVYLHNIVQYISFHHTRNISCDKTISIIPTSLENIIMNADNLFI